MDDSILTELLESARQASRALSASATPPERSAAAYRLDAALAAVRLAAEAGKEADPEFDGEVYDPAHDKGRLRRQIGRVFDAMRDGVWRTLEEISTSTKDPHASISAQLRHLRKSRFGSYVVEKRPRGHRRAGLFEYRLRSPAGTTIK